MQEVISCQLGEFYDNVNKPHYGITTVKDFNYLGVRPTREVKSRVEFVFDTRGLTDATSFHFWISRLENANVNRNLLWKIETAEVLELDGTTRGELPYDEVYDDGFKIDKNGVTVGANTTPEAYQVMFKQLVQVKLILIMLLSVLFLNQNTLKLMTAKHLILWNL